MLMANRWCCGGNRHADAPPSGAAAAPLLGPEVVLVVESIDSYGDYGATTAPPPEHAPPASPPPVRGFGRIFSDLVRTPEYWLFVVVIGFGIGIGGAFALQLGVMAMSFDMTATQVAHVNVAFGVVQLVGRLLVVVLQAKVAQAGPALRAFYNMAAVIFLLLGYVLCYGLASLVMVDAVGVLSMTCAFGLPYGAFWGMVFVLVPLVSDRFQPAEYVPVSSLTLTWIGVGVFALGQVTGRLYDARVADGHVFCYGLECWRLGFLIMAGVSLVTACLAAALYRGYIRPRFAASASASSWGRRRVQ
jgi:hypothetical protein